MERFRTIASVDDFLKGKEVKIIDVFEDCYLIELLENAGQLTAGTSFSCEKDHIEDYNSETKTAQIYSPELAEMLEDHMNRPYEVMHDTPCSSDDCSNDNGFQYELTGHVLDDGEGMYVKKKCKFCGSLTEEGDSEFHAYYRISEFGIESI